jgi:hypothetical protein
MIGSWFISKDKGERGDHGGTMGNRVVEVFSGGEEFRPFMGVVSTEDLEVCFYFLIGPFCLTIHLRMICSGKANIVLADPSKFTGKCGGKLWATVRNKNVL